MILPVAGALQWREQKTAVKVVFQTVDLGVQKGESGEAMVRVEGGGEYGKLGGQRRGEGETV